MEAGGSGDATTSLPTMLQRDCVEPAYSSDALVLPIPSGFVLRYWRSPRAGTGAGAVELAEGLRE